MAYCIHEQQLCRQYPPDRLRAEKNKKGTGRAKWGGNTGNRNLSGSYPYACVNSAAAECSPVYGVLQRKSGLLIFDRHTNLRKLWINRLYSVSGWCINRFCAWLRQFQRKIAIILLLFCTFSPKKGRLPLYQVVESFCPAMASAYKLAQANMAYRRFSFFASPRYTVFL